MKSEKNSLIIHCFVDIIYSMFWCFAIVNKRLAEIHFDKKKNGQMKIFCYCFVRRKDYKTKQEQKWIQEDTKRVKVSYMKGKYKLLKSRK